jgi:RNA polymerase sigma factor (sigma-70 family)
MVLGVCRRVLSDATDAEDAFQATFLVLVRKARSLARPEQISGWLHGVAFRVARKVRADRARRRQREVAIVGVAEPVAPELPEDMTELRRVIDEELDTLPDKYRLPIVLCELEGRTLDEASRILDWPKGTVAGRLSRGRDLLRRRLSRRRTLMPPLFLFAGSETPDPLITLTLSSAAGKTSSPASEALAEAFLRESSQQKLNRSVLLALITFLAITITLVAWAAMANPHADPFPPEGGGCHSKTS